MSTPKVIRALSVMAISALAFVMLQVAPAAASTVATPDPAVPGESVSIAPATEQCGERWALMIANDWGSVEIAWPDSTTTVVDPLTNPIVFTVPTGMTPGTANISLISEDGVVIDFCSGSFEVSEDATVPVIDLRVGLIAVSLVGATVIYRTTTQRRRSTSAA